MQDTLAPPQQKPSSAPAPDNSSGLFSPTIAVLPPLPASETEAQARSQPAGAQAAGSSQPSVSPATAQYPLPNLLPNPEHSSPRLSSNWDPDVIASQCTACHAQFHPITKRRHHCRLCGRIFCQDCSSTRSLIPPSALVLAQNGNRGPGSDAGVHASFAPEGDSSVTYVRSLDASSDNGDYDAGGDTLLYGRGLEQRMLQAREPQRTCDSCRVQLAPLQEELCLRNSNAMRYNFIDEGDPLRRLCNSPLAFTLGHEVRKAAYTLGNLLPSAVLGKGGWNGSGRLGAFIPTTPDLYPPPEADPCHDTANCRTIDPTFRGLDKKMHIPPKLLSRCKGVAIITSAKGGFGFAGVEFGTGLVVARVPTGTGGDLELDAWSAPSAIGLMGIAWGALVGAQVSDHVFLLMTDDAVKLFASEEGKSIQLGVDVGVAVGPVGRSAEADIGAATGGNQNVSDADSIGGAGFAMAPIYTYSLSKGLYAGVSLDGRMVVTRQKVNEKFYGKSVTAYELLSGKVTTPPAAQPLYDALKRCRIYGGDSAITTSIGSSTSDTITQNISAIGLDIGPNNATDSNGTSFNGKDTNNVMFNTSTNAPNHAYVSGGLMERWSHATGAGMPVVSSSGAHHSADSYNLSGRGEPAMVAQYNTQFQAI